MGVFFELDFDLANYLFGSCKAKRVDMSFNLNQKHSNFIKGLLIISFV